MLCLLYKELSLLFLVEFTMSLSVRFCIKVLKKILFCELS
jgi:hypothetical protein